MQANIILQPHGPTADRGGARRTTQHAQEGSCPGPFYACAAAYAVDTQYCTLPCCWSVSLMVNLSTTFTQIIMGNIFFSK